MCAPQEGGWAGPAAKLGRPWLLPGGLLGRSLGRCESGRPDGIRAWATGRTWPYEVLGTSWDRKRDGDLREGSVRAGLSAKVPPQGGSRTPVPISVLSDIPVDGDIGLCHSGTGMLSWGRWGCATALAWSLVSGVSGVIRENKFPGLGRHPQVPDPWPARPLPSTAASGRPTPAAQQLRPELRGLLSGTSCLSCPLGCPTCPLGVSCLLVQVG